MGVGRNGPTVGVEEPLRMGLYGGSFDPPHEGHLALARKALVVGRLAKVLWMPAATSPFKVGQMRASDAHRLAMLRLMTAGDARFEVSDYEMQRAGISYTIDTVRYLREKMPHVQWVLLMGADSLEGLSRWREAQALVQLCEILAFARSGWSMTHVEGFEESISTQILARVVPDFDFRVSSTEIRRRVAVGETVSGLVPDSVSAYLSEHGLYRP